PVASSSATVASPPPPPTSTLSPYTTLFRSHRRNRGRTSETDRRIPGGAIRSAPPPPRERCLPRAPADASPVEKPADPGPRLSFPDRKSTRLNSSHVKTSYAVFCLKKKNGNPSLDAAGGNGSVGRHERDQGVHRLVVNDDPVREGELEADLLDRGDESVAAALRDGP